MWDMVIVGAGPAGLTAAIYGKRAGKTVLVLEKTTFGGQIINTPCIDNYPGMAHVSGFEFANNLYGQATELEAQIRLEQVTDVQEVGEMYRVVTNEDVHDARTVILAVGAANRPLGLEDEKRWIGKGVSYCATCDGAFFRGKDVAVVGGGNTALEDATFLSDYCHHVYVIHRRQEFRGERRQKELLDHRDNVSYILDSVVTSLMGEDTIESIEVQNVNTKETTTIQVAGVFVAIGQMPATEEFRSIVQVDEKGYFAVGEECLTVRKGIFVAGDCRHKEVRQLATATADGAVAALAACEYLAG